MNKKELKEWICDNYNVPDDNNTLAPDMLDGILEYAEYLEDGERFRFLSYTFPDLPASILREVKKETADHITLENRIKKIEHIAKNQRDANELAIQKKIKTQNELVTKAIDLIPRIHDLILVADKCLQEQIPFPRTHGYKHRDFFANSVQHNLGFITHMNIKNERLTKNITHIGIRDDDSIASDGTTITIRIHGKLNDYEIKPITREEYDEKTSPIIISLTKALLNDFDNLETAFYAWIDNLT